MTMRAVCLAIAALMLAACGPTDGSKPEPQSAPAAASPESAQAAPANPGVFIPPAAVDPAIATACTNGLKARGLKENELWLMAHTPDGICPNNGVTEARIREILDKDWDAAGCRQYSKAEMLKTLNSGACGGDAG